MFKLFILILFYCLINIQIAHKIKPIYVDIKINEEWKEKREFNYLNNIKEEEEPFILRTKKDCRGYNFVENITKLLRIIKKDNKTNIFKGEISTKSCHFKPTEELKIKIIIELANNKIIKNLLPNLEKQEFKRNEFIKINKNIYLTSIINKIGNNKENKTLNDKIKYYKKNLLKNYWTQINLISYKIELLNKYKRINNIEELKELENKIILIGKQIIIENDQNPINKIYKIANKEYKTNDKEFKKLSMDLNLTIKSLLQKIWVCADLRRNNDLKTDFDIKFYVYSNKNKINLTKVQFKKTRLERKRNKFKIISISDIQHEQNYFIFNSNLLNKKKERYLIKRTPLKQQCILLHFLVILIYFLKACNNILFIKSGFSVSIKKSTKIALNKENIIPFFSEKLFSRLLCKNRVNPYIFKWYILSIFYFHFFNNPNRKKTIKNKNGEIFNHLFY
ncbi:GATA-type domain-containing protein [Meloidogyne graminicola]|uniref:GATA-type domain-containing protein n=1 Tax=Meloidogyne graminicola TaxID=189291 RepID=A0A8S9ZK00_9BILA|nr:GATA-type domain-containing protein [Meloidogyne graminicola]